MQQARSMCRGREYFRKHLAKSRRRKEKKQFTRCLLRALASLRDASGRNVLRQTKCAYDLARKRRSRVTVSIATNVRTTAVDDGRYRSEECHRFGRWARRNGALWGRT